MRSNVWREMAEALPLIVWPRDFSLSTTTLLYLELTHLIIARRCRIGVSPTSISAIAATDHHPEGKIAVVCWRAISSSSL